MLISRAESQLLVIDVQERLAPAMEPGRPFIAACANLLRAAALLQVPALASEQYPKGLGRTVPELAALLTETAPREKMEFSCYANPRIHDELTRVGRRQVVIAGIEAHVCVLQTTLELVEAGFAVFVAADATASRRPESRETALRRIADAGATIVTVEMVVFEWLRSAADPQFREISRLIR